MLAFFACLICLSWAKCLTEDPVKQRENLPILKGANFCLCLKWLQQASKRLVVTNLGLNLVSTFEFGTLSLFHALQSVSQAPETFS